MKKHCSYLNIFTIFGVLFGLTIVAWSVDAQIPKPNSPTENQLPAIQGDGNEPNALVGSLQSNAKRDTNEPNTPIEGLQLTAQGESLEPNTPVENLQSSAKRDTNEPNAPIESRQSTTQEESPEPNGLSGALEPAGPANNQQQSDSENSWYAYRIVVERNMFSRQRGPRVVRTSRQVPVAPRAPDPESYVVLRGIVQEDGSFMAFLEDTQTGQVLRVHEGDSVLRGKIKTIKLDSIEYEFENHTTTVTMGLNLQGGMAGATYAGMYDLTQTTSPTTSAPAEGTTQSTSPPAEDEAEILKKLMERRQQQVGK